MVGFPADSIPIPVLLVFTVFRRVIASILVYTILGYGGVWAFGVHEGHPSDHEQVLQHRDLGSNVDVHGCYHCCHAAAHLIGLPPVAPMIPGQARARRGAAQ